MAKVRLWHGKPLLIGSKVALSDNCCCTSHCGGANCQLPQGDCPHALCCSFNLDSNDTSNHDIVNLQNSTTSGFGFYFDGSSWQIYEFPFAASGASLAAVNPFDTWHFLLVQTTRVNDNTVHVEWSVDGVSGAGFDMNWTAGNSAILSQVGASDGSGSGTGNAHRTIDCLSILANPTTPETDFNFPPQSFDSLSAGASIVSGQLRIDATGTAAFAEKDFAIGYAMTCVPTGACCSGETCTATIQADCAGTWLGAGTDCDPNPCCLDSKSVSVSGISFCSDCIFLASNHGFKISDDTIASGSPWTLGGGRLISHGCIGCGWDSLSLVTQPNIKIHDYADGTCTGSATDFNDAPIIIAARIDGLYYCFVYAGYGGVLFFLFYGSNSSPSTISNSLSGCGNSLTINDRFTDCIFGNGTPGSGFKLGRVMGTGGTASIS